MTNNGIRTPVLLAIIGFAGLAIGCVTALALVGRDTASVTNFAILLIANIGGLVVIGREVSGLKSDTENIKKAVNGKLTAQLDAQTEAVNRHVTEAVENAAREENTP